MRKGKKMIIANKVYETSSRNTGTEAATVSGSQYKYLPDCGLRDRLCDILDRFEEKLCNFADAIDKTKS